MCLRGFAERGHDMPKPRIGKPERRLPAQNSDLAVAVARQGAGTAALARHDQDDTRPLAMSATQEIVDRLMGLGKPPPMQVDSRVYLQAATRDVAMLSTVDRSQRPRPVP